jgi:chromatin segregation and condensation protein Rec8/ScpA/Scc1 (kleisin family)
LAIQRTLEVFTNFDDPDTQDIRDAVVDQVKKNRQMKQLATTLKARLKQRARAKATARARESGGKGKGKKKKSVAADIPTNLVDIKPSLKTK